jgi:hypothetical protein
LSLWSQDVVVSLDILLEFEEGRERKCLFKRHCIFLSIGRKSVLSGSDMANPNKEAWNFEFFGSSKRKQGRELELKFN